MVDSIQASSSTSLRLDRSLGYKMPYSLKGRNVLVTGGSRYAYIHTHLDRGRILKKALTFGRGLGALICERFAAEGCNIAVNYLSSEDKAKEVAAKVEKHSVKSVVIQGVG